MNCPNCGYQLSNCTVFCVNCGAKVTGTSQGAAAPSAAPAAHASSPATPTAAPTPAAPPTGPYTGYAPNPYPQAPQVIVNTPDPADRVPSKGDYIVWMLLMPLLNLIPVIGSLVYIILVFVRAFDSTYKARANYFKAMLTIWLIFIILGIIGGVTIALLVSAGLFSLSEFGYYLPF